MTKWEIKNVEGEEKLVETLTSKLQQKLRKLH